MKITLIFIIPLFILSPIISIRFNEEQQPPPKIKRLSIKNDENHCTSLCDSKIYCHGELLHDVQMARIYHDSKTFVDKRLLYPEHVILKKYRDLKTENDVLTKQQIQKFVKENFADENLKSWVPSDYKAIPKIANRIKDDKFRNWAIEVHRIWARLGVKIPDSVRDYPSYHSLIFMPEGFIRAGGRYQEMTYWDTYWITRGLILSGMLKTVKGIITNMVYLVKLYGYVPNGSRKYYIQRSQPPLLIQIAATYHHSTRDDDFIRDCLPFFEAEFQWWYVNRRIDVKKNGNVYRMVRYNAASCFPRPEAYYEDYLLSLNLTTNKKKQRLFTAIMSAAEAGWDFSSRHIKNKDGTNKNLTLLDINTQSMIHVELNAMLLANAIALADWYKIFGYHVKRAYYNKIAKDFFNAIENVLWNEDIGVWLDYDHELGKSRNYFYVSNLSPLWTSSFYSNKSVIPLRTGRIIKYLQKEGIITEKNVPKYYGIPASNINSGEKWDFPNIWAPLQAITIHGLYRSGNPEAGQLALDFAKAWLRTMYEGFQACKHMYDCYNATEIGVPGGGGEYEAQMGFGWTNGFLFEIFNLWGMELSSKDVLTTEIKPGSIKCPQL